MRYIKGISRRQSILFPESVDDYVEENNAVKRIGPAEKSTENMDVAIVKRVLFAPNAWVKREATATFFAGFTKI